MKMLLTLCVILSSAASFADTTGSCGERAELWAFEAIDDLGKENFTVYDQKFLGQLEVPDLLDGADSKFFQSYYVILSADSETVGVAVTTTDRCEIVSSNIIGSN